MLRHWIEQYGVPRALYTDWKNVYVREATEAEKLAGEAPLTQFGRMCQQLGIRIIAANSPQAKGRVERAHGTHQDRLVKKLRLAADRQPRRGQRVSGRSICRSTTGGLRVAAGGRRTTIVAPRAPPSSTRFSGWRRSERLVTTGW